jgi:hypothetical protein
MLGFWLCQAALLGGCVCHRGLNLLFGCSNSMQVTVSDVCGLNLVGRCLCLFKNGGSGVLLFVSISFFCPSIWCVSMASEMH